jgi:hypothetical protein
MPGLPLTAPEPYVDARMLARHMGVSPSTVKRWVRTGAPSHTWGMARTRRFRISEVETWLEQREASADTLPDNTHRAGRLRTARPED